MLILSRKRGEQLVIGNGISITVLEMRSGRVKLGFTAPAEVPIHRQEIHSHDRSSMSGTNAMRRPAVMDALTISEMAMQCLRDSPYKVMRRVSCECKQGILFLRGRLFSLHEKQVAQELVAGVGGVVQVINEIDVA